MKQNKNIIHTNILFNGLKKHGKDGLLDQGYSEEKADTHPAYWRNRSTELAKWPDNQILAPDSKVSTRGMEALLLADTTDRLAAEVLTVASKYVLGKSGVVLIPPEIEQAQSRE